MNFTFDPLDPKLLFIHVLWLVIGAILLGAAFKSKGEWVRASLAALGLAIIGMWTLAILPSWWLYFADGRMHWGGQGCVAINVFEKAATARADAVQCFKQAAKDTVVVIENAVVLGAFVVGFIIWQKKFPKQLAPGESKPEATGGYK